MQSKQVCLHVWGDFACFTDPMCKVERFSYPLPTPSAAKGIFDSIYFKPAIKWYIDEIRVLKPIKYYSYKVNEVGDFMSETTLKTCMKNRQLPFVDTCDKRQQRGNHVLKNVEYLIIGHFEETGHDPSNPIKHYEIFKRRASKGQCHTTPYFGCKEYIAYFEWVDIDQIDNFTPISVSKNIGTMLYGMDYDHIREDGSLPVLTFRAELTNGIMKIPCIQIN